MSLFSSAFDRWLDSSGRGTLAELASESGIDASILSRIRADKIGITFRTLQQLLPYIEARSDRATVAHLLECHLRDEVPDQYEGLIDIRHNTNTLQEAPEDPLKARAMRWLRRAQRDSEFEEMWRLLDAYLPQ